MRQKSKPSRRGTRRTSLTFSRADLTSFHKAILIWFTAHGRNLPWRGIADPYRILISEVMLQQTQIGRVLEKYPLFLRTFPSLRKLAEAHQRDVIVAWKGMGYNNRATRLHRLALQVCARYRGKIPRGFDDLVALPGLGRYTANALLSSAFGKQVPVVDVNIRRFFSRLFWTMRSTTAMGAEEEIWKLAASLLPEDKAYDWNQALMDIGATVCTARRPRCSECPVAGWCRSRRFMRQPPIRRSRQEPSFHGIPNRIYRGRIIEVLRHRKRVRTDLLGGLIHEDYAIQDRQWLQQLLTDLQRDGLITICQNGSKPASFVTLA